MKKILILFAGLCTLLSCTNEELFTPVVASKQTADRTMLVYMAANNSLTNNVKENLDSITAGYMSAHTKGNLLVYLDNNLDNGGKGDAILYRCQSVNGNRIWMEELKRYPEPWNSVSPENMKQVMKDAFASYPAKKYGIILWSHALSWIPANKKTTRSWGEDMGYSMDINDLASTLKSVPGVHLDFALFDACFMSTVEVAYDLRDAVDYIIASPAEILAFGFPYKSLVPRLFSYDSNTISSLAECYKDYYDGSVKQRPSGGRTHSIRMDGNMAVVKCSEMDGLASVTREIMAGHADEVRSLDPYSLQKYFRHPYENFAYDFREFMQKIAAPEEMERLDRQLDKTVIWKYSTPDFLELKIDENRYSGIATHVFKDRGDVRDNYYKTIGWYKAAGWDKIYGAGE